jgi:transposase-like protein
MKPKQNQKKWNDEIAITAYELAKGGLSLKDIAKQLGINIDTLKAWRTNHTIFESALQRGRQLYKQQQSGPSMDFKEYIYAHLPTPLQKIWTEIVEADEEDSGVLQIEKLLANQGTRARQYLFVHALIASNFSLSRALRLTNTPTEVFYRWKENDPEFSRIFKEIHFHRKNFFEDCLFRLVAAGDTQATIFVNKTQNRDRGYGEKTEIEMRIEGEVQHNVVQIGDLDLPLPVRRQLLEAARNRKRIEATVLPETPIPQFVQNTQQEDKI